MADGQKLLTESTNIDNDTVSPRLAPIYLLLGQMKLAQVQHCYVTTMWKQNHFYSTNSYTQFGENKTSVWYPSRG